MDWLGPDRDSIGREKAGIARRGRPAIVGELEPPAGLLQTLAACGASVERAGVDFHGQRHAGGGWRWQHRDGTAMELPDPLLSAPVQYANAAAAIAALHALWSAEPALSAQDWPTAISAGAIGTGLRAASPSARLQPLGGDPPVLVDVGHNPQAARALAAWLDAQPPARVHAVYGALGDKDVAGVIGALGTRIDHWHLAGLERVSPRGLAVDALAHILQRTQPGASFHSYADVPAALAGARRMAHAGSRILAFGSFFVASAVLAQMALEPAPSAAAGTVPVGTVP
jgi:dihydrofolate synthase/folylpolyglutamate synthase